MKNSIIIRNGRVNANLTIQIFEESEFTIASSPALDVSGYGYTEEEAITSLKVNLEIFFEETKRKRTLIKHLVDQGWVLSDNANSTYVTTRGEIPDVHTGSLHQREFNNTYA